jgi:hypothetical protein
MSEPPDAPGFTEAELALADTMILVMKVMAMRGIIDEEGINTVFLDLVSRYQGEHLHSAAAMAEYLRQNTVESDPERALRRLRGMLDQSHEGSA